MFAVGDSRREDPFSVKVFAEMRIVENESKVEKSYYIFYYCGFLVKEGKPLTCRFLLVEPRGIEPLTLYLDNQGLNN